MSDIFISYARADRERVRLLADAFKRKGWSVWWDTGIRHGQDYRARIQEALNQARCVVVAWSQHSINSGWVLDEAQHGLAQKILIPVVIEEGIHPPLGFRSIQTGDITAWLRDPEQNSSFEHLCEDVATLLAETAPPPDHAPDNASEQPEINQTTPPPPLVTGRPRWQWMAAIGLLAATLAVSLYFMLRGSAEQGNSNSPAGTPTPGAQLRADDVPVVDNVTYPIDDLRCEVAKGQNPILERVEQLSPPDYSVDRGTHLLLGKDSSPVSVVAASSLGELEEPRLIVAHISVGTAAGAESYFRQPGVTSSVHVMIARDGSVKQLVPFDYASHHLDDSTWKGLKDLDRYSINIDMENLGPLRREGDGWEGASKVVPNGEVIRLKRYGQMGWHKFTDEQVRAFFKVACALRRAYPRIEAVVGHGELSEARRNLEPGPLFPIEEIRARLFPR